ncbi:glycine betaine/L-proline transporter ProP [Kushneria sp. Sum13]|uniref:glycine betaine/L-proline transporter ProP n=1 Tax=Kushneria sp. Sum13 TaxID=3459196 RepID=UPI0040463211
MTAAHVRPLHKRARRLTVKEVTVVDRAVLNRAIKAAALGNAMEWFDFGVYSYIAVTLGRVFYPSGSAASQLLATLATFAAAFLVRPLGGMFFGPLGDRIGRQKVLAATMIMMAAGTFCIGLIPDYHTIGIMAPILLLVARLVQGFSTGGEYGGAATFIAEYAPDRRRGFMGSWLEFGTLAGYIAGAGIVTALTSLLSDDALLSWGWRVPFLIAGPIGLIGLYIRLRLEETPAFQKQAEAREDESPTPRNPLRHMIMNHYRALLVCVGLVLVFNVTDYMLLSYMPSYLSANLGYDTAHGLVLILLVMACMMIINPFMGKLSDRTGRKPMIFVGCVGFVLLSIPCFLLIGQHSIALVFAGLLIMGLLLTCFTGAMPAALPALFPTDIRYGGLAIAFNISVSLFGGTTPLLAAWLVDTTHNLMMPAFYLMLAGVIGGVTIFLTPETANRPLMGETPTASSHAEAHELTRAYNEDAEARPPESV